MPAYVSSLFSSETIIFLDYENAKKLFHAGYKCFTTQPLILAHIPGFFETISLKVYHSYHCTQRVD